MSEHDDLIAKIIRLERDRADLYTLQASLIPPPDIQAHIAHMTAQIAALLERKRVLMSGAKRYACDTDVAIPAAPMAAHTSVARGKLTPAHVAFIRSHDALTWTQCEQIACDLGVSANAIRRCHAGETYADIGGRPAALSHEQKQTIATGPFTMERYRALADAFGVSAETVRRYARRRGGL